MYGCDSWTIKKAEHWGIDTLNCGAEEDSWESLGLFYSFFLKVSNIQNASKDRKWFYGKHWRFSFSIGLHDPTLTCKIVQRQDIWYSYIGSILKLHHKRQNEKYCFQCLFLHYPEDSIHHPSLIIFMWETSIFKINTIIIQILSWHK